MSDRTWLLREAGVDDRAAVAAMHVEAWRVGYRGIVPDDHLDDLDVAERAARYTFGEPGATITVWIGLVGDEVAGSVGVGPARDGDAVGLGEVQGLYVAPAHWRTGLGTRLLRRGEEILAAAGYREALLWVLEENARARAFYEAAGWVEDGVATTITLGGRDVAEIRLRRELAPPLS